MARRQCKFNDELEAKYPMFKRTKFDVEAFCEVCGINVRIANKGKSDLEQHLSSIKHKTRVQSVSTSKKIDLFIVHKNELEKKILAAEATLAYHTVKHHQSYKSCDCSTKLYRRLFNDSETAAKISSARTKTEAIVNNVLAPNSLNRALERIDSQKIPYVGVCTDGSNHGATKIFPVLVQYFDSELGIQHILINVTSVTDEKSETISELVSINLENCRLKEKCIALTGDNCNTNFGGMERRGENNVFYRLKADLKRDLIGVGCPAHVLNNCVQHALDGLPIDLESIVLKIYNYFHVYTIRTESLKEFCSFVDIAYKKLLYHSKTRWLSLFPAINRILQIYPALKSYFLSQKQTPVIIKMFFENPLNEAYLWFIHSLMYVFHSKIEAIERERNSVMEIIDILATVVYILKERVASEFIRIKVNEIIRKNDHDPRSSCLKGEIVHVYQRGIAYLEMWTSSMNELKNFQWMTLNAKPKWNDIEATLIYLAEKGVHINDSLLFDQSVNMNNFLDEVDGNEYFANKLCCAKWIEYFKNRNYSTSSEFLKICSFCFAIPSQNATTERIFSLMNAQWTDERNRLSIDAVKSLLMVQFNFKEFTCSQFYDYCKNNQKMLSEVRIVKRNMILL